MTVRRCYSHIVRVRSWRRATFLFWKKKKKFFRLRVSSDISRCGQYFFRFIDTLVIQNKDRAYQVHRVGVEHIRSYIYLFWHVCDVNGQTGNSADRQTFWNSSTDGNTFLFIGYSKRIFFSTTNEQFSFYVSANIIKNKSTWICPSIAVHHSLQLYLHYIFTWVITDNFGTSHINTQ